MIQLRALGVLDLRTGSDEALSQVLAQPKRTALLVYLALVGPGRSHPRDKLLTLFWPDQDTEHARNALSQAVHFLRRALGNDIIVNQGVDALAVAPSMIWCDVIAFEEAIAAGNLREALDLYRGDFLDGFHVGSALEFGHWLDAERRRLAERFETALEAMALASDERGDHATALGFWRRLAARVPYNSAVALRLMQALAAAGDPAAAVRQAQIHERLLRDELDVAVPAEMTRFLSRLQTEQTSSTAPHAEARPVAAVRPPEIVARRSWTPTRRTSVIAATLVALAIGVAGAAIAANGHGIDPGELRTLAVLPFEDLSSDSTRRFLADGLHDAVITELARHPELSITSRTSTMRYVAGWKRLPAIAAELGVDGIVEGSVQLEGNEVRITAQLIHGPSDRHLWAQSFRRELSDVLTLQQEVADAIAEQVRVAALPHRDTRRVTRPVGREMFLRELIVRGKHAELARTPVGVQKAKEAYERAVREDSTFASGWAALSNIHTVIARYGFAEPNAAMDTARRFALKAMALDSSLSETRTALAVSLADAFEFGAAEREFKAAIALSPSDAQARLWYAMFLAAMGRGPDALREIRRSMELDPFASRGHFITLMAAEYLTSGRRSLMQTTAGARWRDFLAREPDEPWAYRADAYDLAIEGKCDAAQQQIRRTAQLAPGTIQTMVALAKVEWWCGDRVKAHGMLEEAKRHPRAITHGKLIGFAHAAWGERDSAFVWLNRTEWRFSSLMDLQAIRFLDSLRTDPRYWELLRGLGLPNADQGARQAGTGR